MLLFISRYKIEIFVAMLSDLKGIVSEEKTTH